MAERRAFALSAELRGHEQDVRCVAASARGEVLTASRDASLRVWARADGGGAGFACSKTLLGHSHYVGAVAAMPGTGVVVSGSNDKHVIVWDEASGAPLRVLEGHSDVVSCVAVSEAGDILSGSWDKTVRVWRAGGTGGAEAVDVLSGHTQAVWAVLPFPGSGGLASASGDRSIKLWRESKCVATLSGHGDVVRGLALVPSLGFASVSNDGSLRLWSLDGAALQAVRVCDSFLYAVAALPGGELATVGEDRTLRLFRDGELAQAVTHPAPVWSVSVLPNGDVATGCADGVARVFSAEPARRAPDDALALFDAEVRAQAIAATDIPGQVGGVDVANLPDEAALAEPGVKEGQYKIVRGDDGSPCLYTWSVGEGRWNKIGTVVGDPSQNGQAGGAGGGGGGGGGGATLGQRLYRGQPYDFVFDVDIAEGQPPLQLPYNRGTDPFMAAQAFIHANDLPQAYLEQTAQFITDNAGPSDAVVNARNVDPFTAAGAYVPPPPNAGAGAGGARGGGGHGGAALNVDPLTAAGAYRPTYAPAPAAGGGAAPFEDPLSANRYRPGGAGPPGGGGGGGAGGAGGGAGGAGGAGPPGGGDAAPFPARAAVTFCAMAKPELVLAKLEANNAALAAGAALSAAELHALRAMASALAAAPSGPAAAPADAVGAAALDALAKALRWPADSVFPALDVLRLALLHPAGAAACAALSPPLVPALLAALAAPAAAPPPTVVMALRALCNMCAVPRLHALIGEHVGAVLEAASEALNGAQNGQARTAAATLLLNFAVFVSQSAAPEQEAQAQILSALAPALSALPAGPVGEDLGLRLLATVGTLAHSKLGGAFVRGLTADLGVSEAVGALAASGAASDKVRACATQLGKLLAASG